MGVEMNHWIQAFPARPSRLNHPKLLQSSIVVDCTFTHYTTMGFSHCSSSECKALAAGQIPGHPMPLEDAQDWCARKQTEGQTSSQTLN
jgi:hypothetical protein